MQQLGLQGKKTTLDIATINNGKEVAAKEARLFVAGIKRQPLIELSRVYALDNFPSLVSSIAVKSDVQKWDHLKGLPLYHDEKPKAMMLIGQDNSAALQPLELRHGSLGEPYGVQTPLGWTVNGPLYSTSHET